MKKHVYAIPAIALLAIACTKLANDRSQIDPPTVREVPVIQETQAIGPLAKATMSWVLTDRMNYKRVKVTGSATYDKAGQYWVAKPAGNTFRVAVNTLEQLDEKMIYQNSINHQLLVQKGYMHTSDDWKNIEMTGYFKVGNVKKQDEEITLYVRGARHNDETPKMSCQGTAYKIGITFRGKPNLAKEMFHKDGDGYVFRKNIIPYFKAGSIINEWVGVKAIVYNLEKDNKVTGVYMALYIKKAPFAKGSVWQLWYEDTDRGNWPGKNFVVNQCRSNNPREMISWGGPTATFRIDKANKILFKDLSIKEIRQPR